MADIKYEDLERAYLDASIGANEPNLLVVRGDLILEKRPELKDSIHPDHLYYVSHEEIREVEPIE